MAIINSNPWSDAANYGQGLGNTLSQIMFQLPAMRQQQLLSQAHQHLLEHQTDLADAEASAHRAQAGTYIAQASEFGARQKHEEAQTGEITTGEATKIQLGDSLQKVSEAMLSGEDPRVHISNAVNAIARLPYKDREKVVEQMSQLVDSANPKYRQQLGLGQHAIVPVASQGGLYDAVNNQMVAQMPQHLGYGVQMADTSTGAPIGPGGRDRPLADALHSAATGAYGRAYFGAITPKLRKGVMDSAPDFFNSLPGLGMPANAPPIVPGRGTNALAGRIRRNPDTGQLEPVP